jgi:cell division transport system ATP-binding protein
LIEFRSVSMTYKAGIHALKNISFVIPDGEFVFVIGKSGSGKSTLIKLLTCEEDPSAGSVFIDDYEISYLKRSLVPYLRRNIGMVFQDFRLIPSKTVYENIAFAMEIIGASEKNIKTRVPIVLSTVGLREKAGMRPNQLSGGEQQRVAIARAMVNNPMLILADEPTGNLDPVNSESIMALLEEINANGTTIIVCTHDSSIVNKMRRRVIEISDGRIVRDDKLGEYNLAETVQKKFRKSSFESGNSGDQERLAANVPLFINRRSAEPFVRNINIKFDVEDPERKEAEQIKVQESDQDQDQDQIELFEVVESRKEKQS